MVLQPPPPADALPLSLSTRSQAAMPFAERLHRLRAREQAWKLCDLRHRVSLDVPYHVNVYEFVGGMYGIGAQTRGAQNAEIRVYKLPKRTTGTIGDTSQEESVKDNGHQDDAQQGDVLDTLPASADAPHPRRAPTINVEEISHLLNMDIVDFTMDPSKNLLVLVELANDELVAFSPNLLL